MAGKKDNAMVIVLTDMTDNQAAQMLKETVKAKKKYAPEARGTMACGKRSDVGGLLQSGMKKVKMIAGRKAEEKGEANGQQKQ